MKLNNDMEELLKYFKEQGFKHEEKSQPFVSFNQLEKGNNGFILLYLFDRLTFQNKQGSTISFDGDSKNFDVDIDTDFLVFKKAKTLFSLKITIEEVE